MWDSILDILEEKAAEGLDVRLIYDDMGCIMTLPRNYYKRMEKLGIRCCTFHRFQPVLTGTFNNRDHRKICVIDSEVAFTGGVNLADEYINRRERFGHWLDCGVMLRGEAVYSFTLMFLSMWDYIRHEEDDASRFLPRPGEEEAQAEAQLFRAVHNQRDRTAQSQHGQAHQQRRGVAAQHDLRARHRHGQGPAVPVRPLVKAHGHHWQQYDVYHAQRAEKLPVPHRDADDQPDREHQEHGFGLRPQAEQILEYERLHFDSPFRK